jgi:multiple sugar transport system ATP-binding protein
MAEIILDHVSKRYSKGHGPFAVKDLSLRIRDKEFMVFLGPSGCGKSSILRMIAGLEKITEGKLSFDDNHVNDLPPQARDIAMAFENYALYPTIAVKDNIAFPLKIRHWPQSRIDEKVAWAAKAVQITDILHRRPFELSGGQQQRVSLARALVREPQAFLFDEPLSHLDMKQRQAMRAEIKKLHSQLQKTMIYVTHDQNEAMALADRIAVMHRAELQQVGTPEEILNDPANAFVGGFVGEPAMNFLDVEVRIEGGGNAWIAYAGCRLADLPGMLDPANQQALLSPLQAGIRPHRIKFSGTRMRATDLAAEVSTYESLGERGVLTVRLKSQDLTILTLPDQTFRKAQPLWIHCPLEHMHFFSKETGKRFHLDSLDRRLIYEGHGTCRN